MSSDSEVRFDALALPPFLLTALEESGYEIPTPIQAEAIPPLLEGRDVRGLAQTGTGKTAAFALPILARIDPSLNVTQALILAPTRELVIQVCAAMDKYAKHLPGFRSVAIYGGQPMGTQLHALNRGVHVVVGTPGRTMDHLRRKSMVLSDLRILVLDEADEMLRMGFIEDVEWILEHTPEDRQTALFSATMPPAIAKITRNYQNDPVEIKAQSNSASLSTIKHFFAEVHPARKLEGLARLLEVEERDGTILFVRTKASTVELEQELQRMGHSSAAINGDMNQRQREEAIERLRSGHVDLLVATDVAARGIDVARVTHVINYDLPFDREAYVHRIGRTGRAGREGKAISLISRRDWRTLKNIERHMRIEIAEIQVPDNQTIEKHRRERLLEKLKGVIATQQLDEHRKAVAELAAEGSLEETAAALLFMAQDALPSLKLGPDRRPARSERPDRSDRSDRPSRSEHRGARDGYKGRRENSSPRKFGRDRERSEHRPENRSGERSAPNRDPRERGQRPDRAPRARAEQPATDNYRLDVGRVHGATPRDIVGAIANEAGIESRLIGRIDLHEDHSTVEMPKSMPEDVYKVFSNLWVRNQKLNPRRVDGERNFSAPPAARPKPKATRKPAPKLKRKYTPGDDHADKENQDSV